MLEVSCYSRQFIRVLQQGIYAVFFVKDHVVVYGDVPDTALGPCQHSYRPTWEHPRSGPIVPLTIHTRSLLLGSCDFEAQLTPYRGVFLGGSGSPICAVPVVTVIQGLVSSLQFAE